MNEKIPYWVDLTEGCIKSYQWWSIGHVRKNRINMKLEQSGVFEIGLFRFSDYAFEFLYFTPL